MKNQNTPKGTSAKPHYEFDIQALRGYRAFAVVCSDYRGKPWVDRILEDPRDARFCARVIRGTTFGVRVCVVPLEVPRYYFNQRSY